MNNLERAMCEGLKSIGRLIVNIAAVPLAIVSVLLVAVFLVAGILWLTVLAVFLVASAVAGALPALAWVAVLAALELLESRWTR